MTSYAYYSAYPTTTSSHFVPLHTMTPSSLSTALNDPLWLTPRHAQPVPPISLTTIGIPEQPPLPPPYAPGSLLVPHAPSPDSTSSLTNSDYASEPTLDGVHGNYDYTDASGSTSIAYNTSGAASAFDGQYNTAPIPYYAADGTVSRHEYEPGTSAIVRVTPSKRTVQVPNVDVKTVSSYLPSPASSYGGDGVRARRPAAEVKLLPISQNAMRSYTTMPINGVKVESPTSSNVFTGYDGYRQYISLDTVDSQAQRSPPQQGSFGPEPISPISPVYQTSLYYESAYTAAPAHAYVHTSVSPPYTQPQVLDPRAAAFGGEPPVIIAIDGDLSDGYSPNSGSDTEGSLVVPALVPEYAPAGHGHSDVGESEPEYESDGYFYEEDDGSEYEDSPAARRGTSQRTQARKYRRLVVPEFSNEAHTEFGEDFFAPIDQRPRTARASAASMPLPVPVPNLTKKSRGRRVPTVNSLAAKGGITKTTRAYMCKIDGCGKCFARGEHLKRHVRSIHTNEKPHACPYPGCDKSFSRHDNLGQHMRIHKDFPSKRR